MNFFESQDRVRKNTFQLVLLFSLAVITLIVMTNLLVMVVFGYLNSKQVQGVGGTAVMQHFDWQTFATISVGVIAVVLVGSLYKIMALSSGGKAVAEALGGQLIPQNTDDPKQRRLLNVVEEMAIASGTPAPPVYVLTQEQGINAFAAGFSPRDAVIGVTQGTIEHLSRDQLQGVIAHEFSHIFNGDMRLNIRLMGVLNGILIIGIAGYYMLYATSYSRQGRSNDKNGGGILALAIGLMVIGYAGTFFGNLIKAAVSRQREYLADASAVQFTRNPDGIAGALKRIGGLASGSRVDNPVAPEVSHAFFAQGVSGFVQALFATHPPLEERIRRIDPHWDGQFDTADSDDAPVDEPVSGKKATMTPEQIANTVSSVMVGAGMAHVAHAIDQIGSPKAETVDHARALISTLPVDIREAAREPYGARAVIYALAFDSEQQVRDQQIAYLQVHADPAVFALTQQRSPQMQSLDITHRLPIMNIAIPALKQLSLDQYQRFRDNLVALIEMDSRVDLLEWSLQKILFSHLDGQFFKLAHAKTRYTHVGQLKKEIELVLSVMAYAGQEAAPKVAAAFAAACETLDISGLELLDKEAITLPALDAAMQELEKLKPLAKPQLLKACAASVVQDHVISPVEIELLRAFSDAIGCPMPPIVT